MAIIYQNQLLVNKLHKKESSAIRKIARFIEVVIYIIHI